MEAIDELLNKLEEFRDIIFDIDNIYNRHPELCTDKNVDLTLIIPDEDAKILGCQIDNVIKEIEGKIEDEDEEDNEDENEYGIKGD